MKRIFFFLIALSSSLQAQLAPQDTAPETGELERLLAARPVVSGPLTLDEAVTLALRESPVIRGAAEEVAASLGRLNAARAERRPFLSANTFATGGTFGSIVGSPPIAMMPGALMNVPRGPFFDQNLSLMIPLYTGGRLSTLVRQAEALRSASQADLENQRQEVALLTRAAFREVQARRAMADVQRSRLKENQEQLRLDRVRADEGKIPPFFVLRQEAEVAATQQELTNAERDIELTLLQLKTVMGVHPASKIEVTGDLEYSPNLTAARAELSGFLRAAERARPELRSTTQRIAAAEWEAKATGQSYRPQISAFVMGDIMKMRGQNATGGTTYGLAASVPLFTGGRRSAAVQTAQAEKRRLQQERERIALEIAQDVEAAYRNRRAAEQNIVTAQSALKAAQEEYRVARLRYESGRAVLVEVLDALTARTQAESNLVQSLLAYNVARDQLLRATGSAELLSAPANR